MKNRVFCLMVVIFLLTGVLKSQSLEKDPRVASALKLVEVWVDAQLDYNDIPGMSMGIVYDQDLVWKKGFGYADKEKKTPACPNTIYSICSISKLFTSISIMQLWEQGKLRLDDSLSKHISWFNLKDKYPDAPEITIQGVLTHSSGLPREAAFSYWTGPSFPFPTREQIIKRLSDQEELYPADTYYQYSNLGMALLGQVVVSISGQPFDEYVKQHILIPLGLKDTSPEIPLEKKGEQLATGYSRRFRDGSRKIMPDYLVKGMAPAAGFASTVEDLARFASWQFRLLEKGGHEVLDVNTLKKMHRVHWLDPNWRTTRGLGFSVSHWNGKIYVGHGGSCPGYRTQLLLCPEDKIAVIVMTNAHDVSPSSYVREIFEIVASDIKKASEFPVQAKEAAAELEKFEGRYDRPLGRELNVIVFNGKLKVLSLPNDNPSSSLVSLKHMEKNVFRRVRDDGKLAEKYVFELGPDGEVTRLVRNSQYYIRINR
jgi:CubicO group peptidase (beta-lactamase class C family)